MKTFIYGQKWKSKDSKYISLLIEKLEKEEIEYSFYKDYQEQAGYAEAR